MFILFVIVIPINHLFMISMIPISLLSQSIKFIFNQQIIEAVFGYHSFTVRFLWVNLTINLNILYLSALVRIVVE